MTRTSPGSAAAPAAGAALALAGLRLAWARHREQSPGDPGGVRAHDGVRLHVRDTGRADADLTVVLVHGYGADLGMWDAQEAALREQVRVLRVDLRGHGRSGWSGPRAATPRRLGHDLAAVLEQRAPGSACVLVGHSMGGAAVLGLAGQRPDLVGGTVVGAALLATAAGPLTAPAPSPAARLRRRLAAAAGAVLWAVAPVLSAARPFRAGPVRRLLLRRLFAQSPTPEQARAVLGSWQRTPAVVLTSYLLGLTADEQRQAAEVLSRVPVLLLAGTEDAVIDPQASRRLAARTGPTARLVLVPGAGHMVPLSHPEEVGAALRDLLDAVRPPPAPPAVRTVPAADPLGAP